MSLFFKRSTAAPRSILQNSPIVPEDKTVSLTVGQVVELPLGESPRVVNVGTEKDVVLRIELPVLTRTTLIQTINEIGIAGSEF
jgi:hypothetical protein